MFVEEKLAVGSAPRPLSGAARPRHRFRTTHRAGTVSRVHALLIEIAGTVWLVDLPSSMGIAVDQQGTWKTVSHAALQPRTRVDLGSEATLVTWRPT